MFAVYLENLSLRRGALGVDLENAPFHLTGDLFFLLLFSDFFLSYLSSLPFPIVCHVSFPTLPTLSMFYILL